MPESIIADHPPQDGQQWENQCARCGSSMDWQDCDGCGGEGFAGHDCGEDTCCCMWPEENMLCDFCDGDGGWSVCGSGAEWCEANPLPGRESIRRGEVEWFVIERVSP